MDAQGKTVGGDECCVASVFHSAKEGETRGVDSRGTVSEYYML